MHELEVLDMPVLLRLVCRCYITARPKNRTGELKSRLLRYNMWVVL